MILTISKYCNLIQLQVEIYNKIPSLNPINNRAQILVEGNNDITCITLSEDVKEVDDIIKTLNEVIDNHLPKLEKRQENWKGLEESLRSSKPFMRVYMESKNKAQITPTYALIMDCITSSKNIDTLAFALNDLNASITNGFSKEEINIINEKLAANHFEVQLSIGEDTADIFIPPPNWESLEKTLSQNNLFFRVYNLAKTNTIINCIFTLLMDCITSSRNESTLNFVLNELKNNLVPSLSQEEIIQINNMLLVNNFTFSI